MVNSDGPINPFILTGESIGDTVSVWTLFSHTGLYIMAIGLFIPAGLGMVPTCQISAPTFTIRFYAIY